MSLGFKSFEARGMAPDTWITVGQEPSGVIEMIDPGVNPALFKAGDRVMVLHYEACRVCDNRRIGWTKKCNAGSSPHGTAVQGGDADSRVTACNRTMNSVTMCSKRRDRCFIRPEHAGWATMNWPSWIAGFNYTVLPVFR